LGSTVPLVPLSFRAWTASLQSPAARCPRRCLHRPLRLLLSGAAPAPEQQRPPPAQWRAATQGAWPESGSCGGKVGMGSGVVGACTEVLNRGAEQHCPQEAHRCLFQRRRQPHHSHPCCHRGPPTAAPDPLPSALPLQSLTSPPTGRLQEHQWGRGSLRTEKGNCRTAVAPCCRHGRHSYARIRRTQAGSAHKQLLSFPPHPWSLGRTPTQSSWQ